MTIEERLAIVKEVMDITDMQIANRLKTLDTSQQLEDDPMNLVLQFEINKLHNESLELHKRSLDLEARL